MYAEFRSKKTPDQSRHLDKVVETSVEVIPNITTIFLFISEIETVSNKIHHYYCPCFSECRPIQDHLPAAQVTTAYCLSRIKFFLTRFIIDWLELGSCYCVATDAVQVPTRPACPSKTATPASTISTISSLK